VKDHEVQRGRDMENEQRLEQQKKMRKHNALMGCTGQRQMMQATDGTATYIQTPLRRQLAVSHWIGNLRSSLWMDLRGSRQV
jgi:hypothetical protein